MIYFHGVGMQYAAGTLTLENINLHLGKGTMTFISGRSGSGKSSMLRLIALIERQCYGQIIIDGQDLKQIKNKSIPYYRRKIGLVFQDHRLLQDRNVFENVALPLVVSGHRRTEIRKRVNAALDKVGLLKKSLLFPMTLSGGEQQRVGIARAVVNRPALLLADEPTGNLDPTLSIEIMELIEQFNQVGVTVLIASHDMTMIKKLRKRILILKDGRLPNYFVNTL